MYTNNEIVKATSIFGAKYSRMDQVKFVKVSFLNTLSHLL